MQVRRRQPTIDLQQAFEESGIREVLDQLDRELVGLAPVKTRIREIAALLLVDKLRREHRPDQRDADAAHVVHRQSRHRQDHGGAARWPTSCTGSATSAPSHLVTVTRDDLVGQYIGHTAPKTKEVLKRAMGGVLFIDEAYYLYRPENERDYGQEAIEILLQVMENQRDDLVVIVAGYADRMDRFFASNPGFRSRIAHHIDFPDYTPDELLAIGAADAGRAELPLQPGCRAGVPRLYRAPDAPAAFRQRPLDPQRPRPRPPAPGDPAVRERAAVR